MIGIHHLSSFSLLLSFYNPKDRGKYKILVFHPIKKVLLFILENKQIIQFLDLEEDLL